MYKDITCFLKRSFSLICFAGFLVCCKFLSCLSRGLPPLNVSEGGEVNRKKYFIFKKTIETYVLFLL
ncbi:hypothetical protein MLA2C4_17545 [Bacillus mobilis]|nr:hypothetical protein MLA2C4_17545 [Bacillus mobilis]